MFTLICGHPRAGKTTYSKRFENAIHLDTDGLYAGVRRKVERRLGDVVVEGVYNHKAQRLSVLSAYQGNGRKTCIWLDTPKEVRQARTGARIHDHPFEPPTFSEGWDEIIIIRGDNDVESRSNQGET